MAAVSQTLLLIFYSVADSHKLHYCFYCSYPLFLLACVLNGRLSYLEYVDDRSELYLEQWSRKCLFVLISRTYRLFSLGFWCFALLFLYVEKAEHTRLPSLQSHNPCKLFSSGIRPKLAISAMVIFRIESLRLPIWQIREILVFACK